MSRTGLWAAAGGGVLLLLLVSRAQRAAMPQGPVYDRAISERDLDALTRMLLTETSFALDPAEMAQIVWVAVNRASKSGRTLYETVYPPGIPTWNTGQAYRVRYLDSRASPRYDAARNFVLEVLAGRVAPNRRYTKFVHPRGMPEGPPCAKNRVAVSTAEEGIRCLPFAQGTRIGKALFA